MIILEPYEICPYMNECPFIKQMEGLFCYGSQSDRDSNFECHFVNNGVFKNSLTEKEKINHG